MSRWLKNVGNFLEKLDEGAERVVEDRIVGTSGGALNDVPEDVQLQSILNARGLSHNDQDEDDYDDYDDNPEEGSGDFINVTKSSTSGTSYKETKQEMPATTASEPKEKDSARSYRNDDDETGVSQKIKTETTLVSENDAEITTGEEAMTSVPSYSPLAVPSSVTEKRDNSASTESMKIELKTPLKGEVEQTEPMSGSDMNMAMLAPHSHAILREAQKESRTLRRHVVSLNKQLEHVETELQAQRVELERAAERLEKDRIRHKEDREKEKSRHADEIKALKAQNEKSMKELKQRSDKQVEEIRKQLRDVEERRMQEGGDWNKELIDAVQREQEMAQKYALLEDEKGTLLSQIAILQDQQEALGNRIESLTQTAENAMERERESDMRLDEALNLHARQLAQRQARESELERTVAELGAALVSARSKSNTSVGSNNNANQRGSQSTSTPAGEDSGSPEARLQALEQDMEGLLVQLNFEKQRSETLQNELRDVSKERTDEATAHHSRQIKYDRQVAELSHTIARLEAELRNSSNDRDGKGAFSSVAEKEDAKHLRELSEEVLRQREKLASNNSEISALKSRLKVANERLRTAEAALEAADSRPNDADDWSGDLEQAPASGGTDGGMRRRGGLGSLKRSGKKPKEMSMRAALHLDAVRSQSSEQIGKALDGVDAFLVSSGKFLRYNALARLLFIAYLLMLHVWTFVLVIIHAHGFETVHGDFGAGQGIGHGPHALMQEQVPAVPDQAQTAVAADGPGHG